MSPEILTSVFGTIWYGSVQRSSFNSEITRADFSNGRFALRRASELARVFGLESGKDERAPQRQQHSR